MQQNINNNYANTSNAKKISDIREKTYKYNDTLMEDKIARLPFQEIDTKRLLMERNTPEMHYITNLYTTLVVIEKNLRSYNNLSRQNISLEQVKKMIPEMQNICNCTTDFINKFPEYSYSDIVQQSFNLIGIIIARVEEIIKIYYEKNHINLKYKLVVLLCGFILLMIIILFIILKEFAII